MDRQSLGTPALADAYWNARRIAHQRVSVDQCRRAKPRNLQSCGGGPIVYAAVPVRHPICRIYRDDEIKVRLQFDERDRLEQTRLDMDPYRSLPLPFGGATLHWAR